MNGLIIHGAKVTGMSEAGSWVYITIDIGNDENVKLVLRSGSPAIEKFSFMGNVKVSIEPVTSPSSSSAA